MSPENGGLCGLYLGENSRMARSRKHETQRRRLNLALIKSWSPHAPPIITKTCGKIFVMESKCVPGGPWKSPGTREVAS